MTTTCSAPPTVKPQCSAPLVGPCQTCGSCQFIDTRIHGGRSVRRDCGRCGRTWGFPIWKP